MDLFSEAGYMFLLRWSHFLAGITWIGLLYYFNLVQVPFLGSVTEATTKKDVTTKLVPRALWWFRWAAMFTVIAGLLMLLNFHMTIGPSFWSSARGVSISIGGVLGIIMWYNVWFIIWPNQKLIIGAAEQGKGPTELGGKPRAVLLASRTNTMLSIPMLFFMAASSHMPWGIM